MIETGGWGGIAHYAFNLANALGELGTDVGLLTNTRYELEALPRRFDVDACFDGAARYPRLVLTLVRRLAKLAPDVVHLQSPLSTRFDAFLWPLVRTRYPLAITAHNVRSHEGTGWERGALWRCLRGADGVVVHTRESAEAVRERLPRARIAVIHHGDYAFFGAGRPADRAAARARLGLPARARILLAFGAIRPYKGIHGAIGALPRIRARHPDAHLVVAGPLLVGTEDEYRTAIARAGVADAVTFRPRYVPHDEVLLYFAAADVAIYNYRDVTDSGSLRIACALGTPVVATAVGGFREFLTDGVTGRLVDPEAPGRLADAVSELLADPAAAARLAHAARGLATRAWSWADSAKATLDFYHAILRGVPAAPAPWCA